MRPLLRTAFSPQQQSQSKATSKHQRAQQNQAAKQQQDSAEQQPAQQQQQQQQAQQGSDAQQMHDEGAQSLLDQQQEGSPTDPMQPQRLQGDVGPQPTPQGNSDTSDLLDVDQSDVAKGQAQVDQAQLKAMTAGRKAQKGKRTKKDYAAWAGATAETRAIATAHLEGNPDAPHTPHQEQRRPVKQGEDTHLSLPLHAVMLQQDLLQAVSRTCCSCCMSWLTQTQCISKLSSLSLLLIYAFAYLSIWSLTWPMLSQQDNHLRQAVHSQRCQMDLVASLWGGADPLLSRLPNPAVVLQHCMRYVDSRHITD